MVELPQYSQVPAPAPQTEDPVAKSIAKPNAFAKPGTMATRFRALTAKKTPGRKRKNKRDPRDVIFY